MATYEDGTYRSTIWSRLFIEPFITFKWWLLHKLDPWFEERASLDLAWRVFARKHNTAGKRPICHYDGWEADLDPDEKADVYEFPNGDPGAPPNCLRDIISKNHDKTLNYRPGKVPR